MSNPKKTLYVGLGSPRGNYLKPLADLEKSVRPGEMKYVLVAHDDWCPIFWGGSCECNPIITEVAHTEPYKEDPK